MKTFACTLGAVPTESDVELVLAEQSFTVWLSTTYSTILQLKILQNASAT